MLWLFSLDYEQGRVEVGVAINQRYREGVLVQGALAG